MLTLFERLTAEQLPFYLHLMKHLAHKGHPVPDPRANAAGDILHTVCGKPAAVVSRLAAAANSPPGCALRRRGRHAGTHAPGRARLRRQQPNLRGLPWWNETVPVVLPHIDAEAAALLRRAGLPEPVLPPAARMPPCRAARCMPTCSATT